MNTRISHDCRSRIDQVSDAHRGGVTLVETIMVVTLLAAAAVAGGFMLDGQWLSRRGATDVTKEVGETIRAARNTAMMNQTVVDVRHDRIRGHEFLSIVEQAGPIRSGKKWEVDLGPAPSIKGSPTQISFKPTGSADRDLEWKISDGATAGIVFVSAVDGTVTQKLP